MYMRHYFLTSVNLAASGPQNTMSKAAYQQLCRIRLLSPLLPRDFISSPSPPCLLQYVPAPRASLGFLIHPKVAFASGLLRLLPLSGILFLLQSSI